MLRKVKHSTETEKRLTSSGGTLPFLQGRAAAAKSEAALQQAEALLGGSSAGSDAGSADSSGRRACRSAAGRGSAAGSSSDGSGGGGAGGAGGPPVVCGLGPSSRVKPLLQSLHAFMEQHVYPAEEALNQHAHSEQVRALSQHAQREGEGGWATAGERPGPGAGSWSGWKGLACGPPTAVHLLGTQLPACLPTASPGNYLHRAPMHTQNHQRHGGVHCSALLVLRGGPAALDDPPAAGAAEGGRQEAGAVSACLHPPALRLSVHLRLAVPGCLHCACDAPAVSLGPRHPYPPATHPLPLASSHRWNLWIPAAMAAMLRPLLQASGLPPQEQQLLLGAGLTNLEYAHCAEVGVQRWGRSGSAVSG